MINSHFLFEKYDARAIKRFEIFQKLRDSETNSSEGKRKIVLEAPVRSFCNFKQNALDETLHFGYLMQLWFQ